METAPVDDSGTRLAYIDSGAPPTASSTYTTLVCVHGNTYNAQTFSRLLHLAHRYNLRIIALNRRDYTGSTPFSDAELDVIKGNDDVAHRAFLRNRGLEIARFLCWVIKEKEIPRVNEDETAGGLALLGWSMGNITTLSFLAYLDSYPDEVLQMLSPYVRKFIFYDNAHNFFGYATPEGGYRFSADPDIPAHKRVSAFAKWVSSYYSHPVYSNEKGSVSRSIAALQVRAPEKAYRTCTQDTFTPDELLSVMDPEPATRSEMFFWKFALSTMRDLTHKALTFREDSHLLPALKVSVVYGSASIWVCQWAAWELEKDYNGWKEVGEQVRSIKFVCVEGENHFMHWDNAELFLATVSGVDAVCDQGAGGRVAVV